MNRLDLDDPEGAIVVANSRVVTYDSVAEDKKLWIKDTNFSLTGLVMDTQLGAHFADAAVASFLLSPQDHHRYRSPVTGIVKSFRNIPRNYNQVGPAALESGVKALKSNARSYLVIETEKFGDVLFVAIGTKDVRTIRIHEIFRKPGAAIKKGTEVGCFQYGGSSIIVAFRKGAIKFDQDLLELGRQKIQVSVKVGMSLGKANSLNKKVA
ncbi:phosphatidylserine decarboxylase-domain-containing protein [Hypoxylon rubiginosum]|uniref:Phosphatidylserine decarboxylase-domain-containing protein n=1 Tax=Hypoxylon rubiginosum TaxID=110542 RepID=A0ACB9YWJ6_9PEZI|nr:phosphatidylserine decarboxylase-domain-containing protein [Hypoxylon rubiginosum]